MWWSARHAEVRQRLQGHVPERVLTAARLRPHPTSRAVALSPGPVDGAWLAVSPTRLYAFAARGDGVGDPVEVCDRDATTVRRAERLTATPLTLRFGANGSPIELDATRWRAGRRPFFRYLHDPTRTG